MREFTDTEQKLVKALINNVSRKSGLRIGEVLLQVYPIEYIEKNKVDDPFYKETIKICHKVEEGLESKLYEAFSLIIMLIEHRYIVSKEFIDKEIIGKKNPLCYPLDNRHEERTYFNYYDVELWKLLNSHFSVTNSLVDFAKDFKTIEQRRFEAQLNEAKESLITSQKGLKISQLSFIVAVLTLFGTIGFGIWQKCTQQEIDSEQISTIISAIKEQKSISIDKFPDIIPDTLNVRVADAPDKQPINLNVIVKENQPTKVQ